MTFTKAVVVDALKTFGVGILGFLFVAAVPLWGVPFVIYIVGKFIREDVR